MNNPTYKSEPPSGAFICDIKAAMRMAGCRFKPMPRRRKQRLRIRRHAYRKWKEEVEHKRKTEEVIGCELVTDQLTGIKFTKLTIKTPNGIKEDFSIIAGRAP